MSTSETPVLLIETKLNIPHLSDALIERPRLIEWLNQSPSRKVTLISAPAGYGKTTLALMWLQKQQTPVAWVSLNDSENDLASFLNYVVAAIQRLFPGACPEIEELMQATQLPAVDTIAPILINEIAELSSDLSASRFMLVLDDYHYITEPAIHRLMQTLIEHQPKQMHLLLISRQDPLRLPINRLRAQQEITDIRQADLRFTVGETKTFLQAASGLKLSDDFVTTLDRWIEGWVVGLRLASLSMQNLDDPATFVRDLTGTSRYVMEYLIDEVLARQPEAITSFLLKTSILDRLCGPLCEAVAGINDPECNGQAYLKWLETTNTFTISLDTQQNWYRYHHLFKDLLASKLQAEYPTDEIADLHRRAGHWFADNGYVEEALHHMLLAGDSDAAVKLVEDNSHNLLNRLAWTTIERWLSMLPEQVVWHRPKLLVTQAWLRYRQYRISLLDTILDRAESSLESVTDASPAVKTALLGHINTFRSVSAYLLHDDSTKSVALAEQALQQLPDTEKGAQGTAFGYLSLAQQSLGQTGETIQRLQAAIDDPSPLGPAKPQLFLGLAYVQLAAGQLHPMLQTTQQALAFSAKANHGVGTLAAHLVSGLLHYEWNDLNAATEHFSKVIDMRYRGNFFATATCLLGQVRIHQAQGDGEHAQEILSDLRADLLRLHNTHFLPSLDSLQAWQWYLQGDAARALRWATSFAPEAFYEHSLLFEVPSLTWARIIVAHGTENDIRKVLRALQKRLTEARTKHFTQRVIQILVHLTLAHNRLQQKTEALDALRQALALAQPGGFIRTFVDCGPALVPLLQELARQTEAPVHMPYVLAAFSNIPEVQIVADASNSKGSPLADLDVPVDLLTRREEEILRLMQQGLTNQEIADRLIISLFTVKRHATNIFNKLSVSNRRQAVRRAQTLGVLPQE